MKFNLYRGKELVGEAVRFSDGTYSVNWFTRGAAEYLTEEQLKKKRVRLEAA